MITVLRIYNRQKNWWIDTSLLFMIQTHSLFYQFTISTVLFSPPFMADDNSIIQIHLMLICCFLLPSCQIAQIKLWAIWFFIGLISDHFCFPSFILSVRHSLLSCLLDPSYLIENLSCWLPPHRAFIFKFHKWIKTNK